MKKQTNEVWIARDGEKFVEFGDCAQHEVEQSDMWHFWNNVLIIVERAAMDI